LAASRRFRRLVLAICSIMIMTDPDGREFYLLTER
jgi:hypothetical protein